MADLFRNHRALIFLVLFAAAVLAGAVYFIPRPQPARILIITPSTRASPTAQIVVHVSGAVAQPGVFHLPTGSRVIDAIATAGQALGDADLDQLNLARKLVDGEKLTVPFRSTAPSSASASPPATGVPPPAADARIDINSASVEELDRLPGIGPALAKRIVDYRTANGPFTAVEDIKNIRGIGDVVFADIQDLITVGN